MIAEETEAAMTGDTPSGHRRADSAPRATAELLCLLATYEAYGTGMAWSGCLRALAGTGGAR